MLFVAALVAVQFVVAAPAAVESLLAASETLPAVLEMRLVASGALPAQVLEEKLVLVVPKWLVAQDSYSAYFALLAGRRAEPVVMLVELATTVESVALPESLPFAAKQKTEWLAPAAKTLASQELRRKEQWRKLSALEMLAWAQQLVAQFPWLA